MRTIFLLLLLIPLIYTETTDATITVDPTSTDTNDANVVTTTDPQTPVDNTQTTGTKADTTTGTTPETTPEATPEATTSTTTETAPTDTTTGTTPADAAATTGTTTTGATTTETPTDTHTPATTTTTPAATETQPTGTTGTTTPTTKVTGTETHVTAPTTPIVGAAGTQFAGPAPDLYGGLILPYVRPTTVFNVSNTQICGGTTKDKIHFMTSQTVLNEFRWYIETPFSDSTCLFRVTENLDQKDDSSYLVIPPSNRKDVKADGSFPCGRTAGADSAMFDIPDEIDCDACVLEWIWRGPNFEVRQCADITVMGGEDSTCLGTCLNGGMCKRGVCVCPAGYTGDNCQYAPGAIIKSFKKIFIIVGAIILAVVAIITAIALLSWCADKRIKEGERDQRYHTNKKYMEFDGDVPNQPSGVDQPAGHLRAEPRSGY